MIKNMLIIADQEKSHNEVKRGLELAARLGAKVSVVGFVYESVSLMEEQTQKKAIKTLIAHRKKQLQLLVNELSGAGQKVKLEVVWAKEIVPEIIAMVKSQAVDLVIKSGRRSDTLFHTSTDWQLFREAGCSVMVLSSKKWRKAKPVLAAVDLKSRKKAKQELNHKVLRRATQIAEQLDSAIHVVDVINVPAVLRELDIVDVGEQGRKARKDLKPMIKALAEQYNIPEENFHVKSGEVDKVVCSVAAKLKADMLVLGTIGRKGVRGKLLGNTAEKVLENIRTDVCTVRL